MLLGQTESLSIPKGQQAKAEAAFLFSYEIKPGMQTQFEEGYREHLEWHRQVGDPFTWYGWYVVVGDASLGQFVDGTFGHLFEDFDHRVDPAGDRAHSKVHVDPFVEPVRREIWRLRPDLGSVNPLENRERYPLLEVVRYFVRAGREEVFEKAVRAGFSENEKARVWYQIRVGGDIPTYISITPFNTWKDFDPGFTSTLGGRDSVSRVQTQVWAYREDLSYFPEAP